MIAAPHTNDSAPRPATTKPTWVRAWAFTADTIAERPGSGKPGKGFDHGSPAPPLTRGTPVRAGSPGGRTQAQPGGRVRGQDAAAPGLPARTGVTRVSGGAGDP